MLQITEHIETIMNRSKIELYRDSSSIQRKSSLSSSSATAVKNEMLAADSNYPRERTQVTRNTGRTTVSPVISTGR